MIQLKKIYKFKKKLLKKKKKLKILENHLKED